MINTEIIDISKIKRPVLKIWGSLDGSNGEISIYNPCGKIEYYDNGLKKWKSIKRKEGQGQFCRYLIAWQYI